jgi:hypothetical protein
MTHRIRRARLWATILASPLLLVWANRFPWAVIGQQGTDPEWLTYAVNVFDWLFIGGVFTGAVIVIAGWIFDVDLS